MKKQRHDLFAEDHRRQKITQFTKVLDALSGLVDWAALSKMVNEHTGREASQPKGGRPPYPTQAGTSRTNSPKRAAPVNYSLTCRGNSMLPDSWPRVAR